MKNKGLHQYRFSTNPLEEKFAEAWEKLNTRPHSGGNCVDSIVSKDWNNPEYATDREIEICASVIQWLGSPVGQKFLREVGFEFKAPDKYGCDCDLEEGQEPDACVMDSGDYTDCVFAEELRRKKRDKTSCNHWVLIKEARNGDANSKT